MSTHSSVLVWRIPWTEEPYSPWGLKESDRVAEQQQPPVWWSWTGLEEATRVGPLSSWERLRLVLLPRQLSASREERPHQPRGLEARRNEARRSVGFCHAALVDRGRKLQGKVLHQNRGNKSRAQKSLRSGYQERVEPLMAWSSEGLGWWWRPRRRRRSSRAGAASLRAQPDCTGNPTERSAGGKSLRWSKKIKNGRIPSSRNNTELNK